MLLWTWVLTLLSEHMSKMWALQTSSSVWHILQKASLRSLLQSLNEPPDLQVMGATQSFTLENQITGFHLPCRSPNTDLRAQESEVQILTRCEQLN